MSDRVVLSMHRRLDREDEWARACERYEESTEFLADGAQELADTDPAEWTPTLRDAVTDWYRDRRQYDVAVEDREDL